MAPQTTTRAKSAAKAAAPQNEPGSAVLMILDKLIERIKGQQPLRSNDKPLETYAYSQLAAGIMVDPDDFDDAWSPMGGIPFEQVAALATGDGSDPAALLEKALAEKSRAEQAFSAAFKTSQLVDELIKVSTDEVYRTYPGNGRRVSHAYEAMITGMQAVPAPEPSAETKRRVEEARKVLYDLDDEGNILGKSRMYETYVNNASNYARAKSDYAEAQQDHLADPMRAAMWPVAAARYKREVDQAWHDLKAENGDKIEAALDTIQSVGTSINEHMIAKARQVYDQWSVALSGSVASTTPFSYIIPASWSDPNASRTGWTTLKIKSSDYKSHSSKRSNFFSQSGSRSDSSSSSGGGGFSIFGFGIKGGGGTSSQSSSSSSSSGGSTSNVFKNDAKDLTIELEYGVCKVVRPWFIGDLMYLKDWYMVNSKKHSISNGTLEANQNDRLLPLLPEQFLVVRNIRISSRSWGSDGAVLEQHFGRSASSSSKKTVEGGGEVGFSFGFFSIGGGGGHSESHSQSGSSSSSGRSRTSRTHTKFDGTTLEIKGAQIVGWLSTVCPPCAPNDDPNT